MKWGGFLKGFGKPQQISFAKEPAGKTDAGGKAIFLESVGYHYARVTGQIGDRQTIIAP